MSGTRLRKVYHPCFVPRTLLWVVVAFISVFPAWAVSETDEAKNALRTLPPRESRAIVERLGNIRKEITSLQADFIEERTIPSLETPLKFEGRVFYQSKVLFFMEYEKPVHHILRVKDNEALFFVQGSRTADLVDLSAVQGVAGNADIFAVDPARFSEQVLECEDAYVLEKEMKGSEEKKPGPMLSVHLDKNSLLAKKILIRDESGDVTVISLFKVNTNMELPQSVLSFELPEGVKINRLNQP